ncbi:OmpA family protein [Pedobacter sp. L105]|uniref:OmpA family protein n=1 Tax=Pedobacter sp. L105 TaxID=1641871 RepID=UPI00131C7FC0|nr:OmpA family protein [Pedobacter sp. L105]
MKKSLLCLILFSLLILFHHSAKAQYILKAADQQYELFNYSKAIDLYEQAYRKKPTLRTAERLAEANQLTEDYIQAESWYALVVTLPGSKLENILSYGKTLQQNSKYSEAKVQYLSYFDQKKDAPQELRSRMIASCDSALSWMKHPKPFQLNNLNRINSAQSDWGSFPYQNGIVFTSDRATRVSKTHTIRPFLKFDGARLPSKKIYGWTGNSYLKLYMKIGVDSVKLFPLPVKTGYHIGPASFTADGKTIYYTLTKIPERLKGKLTTIYLEIYSSTKDSTGNWTKPVAFAYNKPGVYSVGDPYISPDGKKLYFVSDMPGGMGGIDIYTIQKDEQGVWGMAANLKEVNSAGNERSPYPGQKNHFYFASDGRVGMGGLDIYQYTANSVNPIQNMGYPINSPQDDFAFNVVGTKGLAYLSSNRYGGLGSDDIYAMNEQRVFAFKLVGTVFNSKTDKPVGNAMVTLQKLDGTAKRIETDASGRYSFDLEQEMDYGLTGEKTNYRSYTATVSTKSLRDSATLKRDLFIDLIEIDKAIRLENIYYNFDKWNIRPDAAVELDKLVTVMKENPGIWIELGSHTDSRGKVVYNQWLSQKRAQSAVDYIIQRGISKNRIIAKGYGESQLLNKCSDGVNCTESQHQMNRRTEFKITKK